MKGLLVVSVLAAFLVIASGQSCTPGEKDVPQTEEAVKVSSTDSNSFVKIECNSDSRVPCEGTLTLEKAEQAADSVRVPAVSYAFWVWRHWCRKYTYYWVIPRQWGCRARYLLEDRCYGGCPSVDHASPFRRDYCYCCKGYRPYSQRIQCRIGTLTTYRFSGCGCRTCGRDLTGLHVAPASAA